MNEEGEDKVIWLETKTKTFSLPILEPGRSTPFLVRVVWNVWVPLKASFFACEASWGKALTLH